jgi:AcrR family transcriptional regulator
VSSRQSRRNVAAEPTAASPWTANGLRTRSRERKRDAVIKAAARAFRERGYHNTLIDDIARDLTVTKPTIYYYVENKEQLLFQCFKTGLDLIIAALEEAQKSKASGRERLIAVLTRYAEAITSEYGWCMVRAEDQDLSPAMGKQIKELKSVIDQGMRRLIKAGIQDGSIADCDPKMSAFAIAGALNWVAHWYRSDDTLSPADIAARMTDLFDRGLRPR